MAKQLEEAVTRLDAARRYYESVRVEQDPDLDAVRARLRDAEERLRSCDAEEAMAIGAEAASLRAILDARINGWLSRRREVEPARKALTTAEVDLQRLVSADYDAAIAKGAAGRETHINGWYDSLDELDVLAADISRRYGIAPKRRAAVNQWRAAVNELARVCGIERRPAPAKAEAEG